MPRSAFKRLFHPRDDSLSDREQSQIQIYRLLFLLGTLLCLLFIPLFEVSSPDAVDPIWMRIAVSGILVGVFAASYVSRRVRRHFAAWVRGTIYLIIGWFIFLSALNGFASDYEVGLLLLHAIFTVITGLGARSIRPVIRFTGTSLLAATGAVMVSSASLAGEAVLLGGMATISLVVAIAVQRLISTRERLQDQESRLRGLANSIPGVVFQFYARDDGTWGNYFVSEHAEEVLGIAATPDRFYERVIEGIPASYRDDAIASIEQAIDNQAPWRYEIPFETPSGENIWLLGASAPQVKDDEIVFNGVLLDITERKEAKEELQKTKNRYQTLVENFPSGGVFLFDEDLRYMLGGGAELRDVGLAPSDFRGTTPYDLFPADIAEETAGFYERALEGEMHVFEQRYQGKHYRILTMPIQGRDGEVVSGMAVSLDVTDQKEQQRALKKAKEKAEEASQVKTAMLANMSHEVRTPLTSIIGFTEILKDRLDGTLGGFARRTHESSQQLSETLESILQLSKLEAGATSLDRDRMALGSPVRESIDLLRPTAEEKAIEVDLVAPGPPVVGEWNEDALRRISRNLLENAIKFTPEEGTVTVRVGKRGDEAVLEVADTGIGIREDLLPDVFQAFRQESEGIDREYQGSGLGLSIVKHLVEEFGGTVQVETEKGEGTCFTVRLPLMADGASPE